MRASFYHSPTKDSPPSLVLVPCEPWSVIGSRGDEAMAYSILRDFRSRHPEGAVTIVTGVPSFGETDDGKRLARDFGAKFAYAWRPRLFLSNIVRVYREAQATEVYVLGADCMDGHWSMYLSITLLAAADLAARMGIATRLTGFSWNDHPCPEVIKAFKNVTPKLPILVRDPISYERFDHDVPVGARVPRARGSSGSATLPSGTIGELVADVAFNLKPRTTPEVQTELDWMGKQREAGRFVLGFNIHSMLVPKERLQGLIETVITQLRMFLSAHRQVALALVPHDYRKGGDLEVLRQIAQGLDTDDSRIRLVTAVLSAEELKALASGLDALFTSRMHLGIAALGMGKPISAFAYQGKFVGLFKHVGLPEKLILPPERACELSECLGQLVHDVLLMTQSVAGSLSATLALAKVNLNE